MSPAPANTAKSKLPPSDQTIISNTSAEPGADKDGENTIGSGSLTAQIPEAEDNVDKAGNGTREATTPNEEEEVVEGNEEVDELENDDIRDNAPPLPDEEIPPLPQEPPPVEDDGWAPVWEETAQAFYFYNRFTGATQWTNPRVPEASQFVETAPGVAPLAITSTAVHEDTSANSRPAGGYDPSIHGDYDPTAWYAQPAASEDTDSTVLSSNPSDAYAATGAFNRFTGRWQAADLTPENYNDENKSKRQMNAFFDVDAAANSHDGRSLKAERSGKKLSKTELKQFKEKRKAKKEEKRRAWLRD
jgi:hypothetical protein